MKHFITLIARELGKSTPTVPIELYVLLKNYSFPGNIRELKAMIYDAVSVSESRMFSLATFRRRIGHRVRPGEDPSIQERTSEQLFSELTTLPTLEEAALRLMNEAMRRSDSNQFIASRLLGISQPALSKRLKRLL